MDIVLNHTYDEAKNPNFGVEWNRWEKKKKWPLIISSLSLVGGPCYKIPLSHSLLSEFPICFCHRNDHKLCSLFSLSNIWHMLTLEYRVYALFSLLRKPFTQITSQLAATPLHSNGISAQGSSLTFPSPITLCPHAPLYFFPCLKPLLDLLQYSRIAQCI